MGPSHQAKLAAHLHDRDARHQAIRVIAATGTDPMQAVACGKFRADLHNMLSVLPIEVPSLRARRDDIPMLVTHFLSMHRKRHGKAVQGLSGAAFDVLLRYDYPGNVRELSNLIERGLIFAEAGAWIEISHMFSALEKLPELARTPKPQVTPDADPAQGAQGTLEALEIEMLRRALVETGWNVSQAARKLGLSRPKLDYRIKKFALDRPGP
jgi:two-component system, NtrC family, response regulator HydG